MSLSSATGQIFQELSSKNKETRLKAGHDLFLQVTTSYRGAPHAAALRVLATELTSLS